LNDGGARMMSSWMQNVPIAVTASPSAGTFTTASAAPIQ
jgi:hypothetical protein